MESRTQSNERYDTSVVSKKQNRVFVIDRDRCKGCRICVSVCPTDALFMSDDKTLQGFNFPIENGKCTGCKICLFACPDFVLSIHALKDVIKEEGKL